MNTTNKFFERLGVLFIVILCVFSSWVFITQGLDFNDPDGPGIEDEKVSCEIYYFSNLINSDPTEAGNYSCDEKLEGGVTQLPDFSVNEVSVASEAVFEGDITFNGAAVNLGTINGNANFVGDASENSGTVTGTLTRTYNASTSTSRDFTQNDEVWTVVATNGATVDVTNAIYNNKTTFSTEDGGSFVYPPVVSESLGAGRFSNNESASYSFPVIQNLNAKPLEFDNSKVKNKEKIKKSETETKEEPNTSTGSSVEVVKTEEVKEVAVSAPKAEEKLPVVQVESVEQLKSKIVSSVEDTTKVWYVAPNDTVRYEVSTNNSLNLFRKVSLGITNKDLNQIPVAGSSNPVTPISQRLVGRFLLQVESKGETWFVDAGGYKHRVTSQNLLDVTSKAVVGIDNVKLEQIPVASTAK